MRNRVWPASPTTERAVLGSILLDPRLLERVASILAGPDDFADPGHEAFYRLLLDRLDKGEPFDRVTVQMHITAKEFAEKYKNFPEINGLVDAVDNLYLIEEHANVLARLGRRRRLILAAQKFEQELWLSGADPDDDGGESAEAMEKTIGAIRCQGIRSRARPLGDVLATTIETMRMAADGTIRGLLTPWNRFNLLTGGLQPGFLYVIAGRPGTGKSSLAQAIATHVGARGGGGAYYVSLEMVDNEIGIRHFAAESGIPGSDLSHRPRALNHYQWAELERIRDRMAGANVWLDASATMTIDEIVDQTRLMMTQRGINLLVVDHVGLITPTREQRRLPRHEQVAEYSRSLKRLAMSLDIPVVVAAQLNREIDKRPEGKREPKLSDLRDSGSIEQDANVVAMIDRDTETQSTDATLYLRKNRSGPTAEIRLSFDGQRTKFTEIEASC